MARKPNQTIEHPSHGATYHRDNFAVYEHSTYPRHSVLAGQPCRRFLDSFDTLEAAQAAYPAAKLIAGTTYAPPSLNHLSDDGDL